MSATCTTAHGNARSLAHWVRPEIEPASSWILVRFVSAEPQQELQFLPFLGTWSLCKVAVPFLYPPPLSFEPQDVCCGLDDFCLFQSHSLSLDGLSSCCSETSVSQVESCPSGLLSLQERAQSPGEGSFLTQSWYPSFHNAEKWLESRWCAGLGIWCPKLESWHIPAWAVWPRAKHPTSLSQSNWVWAVRLITSLRLDRV